MRSATPAGAWSGAWPPFWAGLWLPSGGVDMGAGPEEAALPPWVPYFEAEFKEGESISVSPALSLVLAIGTLGLVSKVYTPEEEYDTLLYLAFLLPFPSLSPQNHMMTLSLLLLSLRFTSTFKRCSCLAINTVV